MEQMHHGKSRKRFSGTWGYFIVALISSANYKHLLALANIKDV